jgi:hypothetical protein
MSEMAQEMPPPQGATAAAVPPVGTSSSAPPPPASMPRKMAYVRHLTALHKDQHSKLHAKNAQEIELLEDIRTFMKARSAMEKQYADSLLKLSTSYLNHKIANVPDIQTPGDQDQVKKNLKYLLSLSLSFSVSLRIDIGKQNPHNSATMYKSDAEAKAGTAVNQLALPY